MAGKSGPLARLAGPFCGLGGGVVGESRDLRSLALPHVFIPLPWGRAALGVSRLAGQGGQELLAGSG